LEIYEKVGYSPSTIDDKNMKRLFVAIPLPDAIKKDLYAICCNLPRAKWAEKEQLHLTLCFIGEVNCEMLTDIRIPSLFQYPDPQRGGSQGGGYIPTNQQPNRLLSPFEPELQ